MLAVGGLVLYVLYTLATLAGFDAVLTLPGLAGFVLSIGIAVDANVLIFERIREELDRGKTVRTAIDEGFHHAMPAIIDSNVSTILTAAVLYQYGTGPVKGFAVTLIAGIVASHGHRDLRGADLLPPVAQPLARRPDAEHLAMLRILHGTNYDFIKHWRIAIGITVAFIAIGLAYLGVHGINKSIEFTGGTLMQLEFTQPAQRRRHPRHGGRGRLPERRDPAVRQPARVHGARGRPRGGDDRRGREHGARRSRRRSMRKFGATNLKVVRTEIVGPRVGAELTTQRHHRHPASRSSSR